MCSHPSRALLYDGSRSTCSLFTGKLSLPICFVFTEVLPVRFSLACSPVSVFNGQLSSMLESSAVKVEYNYIILHKNNYYSYRWLNSCILSLCGNMLCILLCFWNIHICHLHNQICNCSVKHQFSFDWIFLQPIAVLLWDHLPTQWFVLLHESTSEAGQFDIFLSKVHTRFFFCKTHVVLQPQLLEFFSNHLHLCHVVESLQSHHPQF